MAQLLLRCKPLVGVASNKDRIAARFLIFLFLFKGWFITYVVNKTLLVFNKPLTFLSNRDIFVRCMNDY